MVELIPTHKSEGITMAILVVDDIADVHDIAELIHYLSRALAEGDVESFISEGTFTLTKNPLPTPTADQLADLVRLDEVEECENHGHREGCSCQSDAADTDPRQGILLDAERHDGPLGYVLCSNVGQHTRLTDCWMCWSDVQRGALALEDALLKVGSQ